MTEWKEWKILVLALTLCNHWVSLYPPCLWHVLASCFASEQIGKLQDLSCLKRNLDTLGTLVTCKRSLAGPPGKEAKKANKCQAPGVYFLLWVSLSLAWQAAELFCFHKPYYVTKILNSDAEPIQRSQQKGRERTIKEMERKKGKKARREKEKGEKENGGGSRDRPRPFNFYCLCSWPPVAGYAIGKILLPSFYVGSKPPLVDNLQRSLLSASCLQTSPQGPLLSLLEAAAARHGVVLSVPDGKKTSMTLSPFTQPPSHCHADYLSQGGGEWKSPKGS